jgi:hypothetical protein
MKFLTLLLLGTLMSNAASRPDPSPAEIQQIIEKFAENETAFSRARESYVFKQKSKLVEYNPTGKQTGFWETHSEYAFDITGKRQEKVLWAPVPALTQLVLTPEDMQDLRDTQPFVVTKSELANYHVRYVGQEVVDELLCVCRAARQNGNRQALFFRDHLHRSGRSDGGEVMGPWHRPAGQR